VTCGNGLVVNLTCPAYAKGTYNVTCPGRERVPQCKTFDGAQFVVNPLCSVVSFDSLSTTCYCAGSTLRRALANGESEATQYGTAFVDIATNFGTTFASAPSLTDVTNNLVILSTLAGVVGMFVAGMFFFLRWDKADTNKYAAKELKESKKKRKVRIAFQFFNSIFPDELRAGSWYKIFMHQLRTEHFLIRLFTTSEQDKSLRTVYWAVAMGKLVAFLFMNCLVASVMYPDDGYCEGFDAAPACNDAKSVGGMFDSCHWRPENASCEFNPPNTDFTTSIIITLIVTMLTVPLEILIEANVELWAQYFHYTELERKIAIDDTPAEGAQLRRYDEFTLSQGYRATLFRAARLEKARQLMDFISVEEEARMVSIYAKEIAVRDQKNIFASVIQQISLKKYRYSVDNLSHKAVCKRVEEVRGEAEMIQKEMEVMDSTEEQEKFLMRQFIVNSFATMQRGVVSKYFLKEYSLKRTESVKNLERASFVFLPLLMLFMLYYVYVFNLAIGSRATNMWLIVTFIGLAQDTFLIAPTKILINFMVINNNVSRDVRMICERLSMRSKLILMRTHGLMRDAGSLVQHFNPACRAARMYPALPISRLLMSLNDTDLPHPELPHPTLLPWAYFSTGVVALLLLPEVLQETVLDIASGAINDFGMIALDWLRRFSVVALVGLILGFVVLVVAVTFCCRSSVREIFTDNPQDVKPSQFELDDLSIKGGRSIKGGSVKQKFSQSSKEKHFFHIESSSEKGHDLIDHGLFAAAAAAHSEDEMEHFGSIWGMQRHKSNRRISIISLKKSKKSNKGMMDMQIPDTRTIKPAPAHQLSRSDSFTLRDHDPDRFSDLDHDPGAFPERSNSFTTCPPTYRGAVHPDPVNIPLGCPSSLSIPEDTHMGFESSDSEGEDGADDDVDEANPDLATSIRAQRQASSKAIAPAAADDTFQQSTVAHYRTPHWDAQAHSSLDSAAPRDSANYETTTPTTPTTAPVTAGASVVSKFSPRATTHVRLEPIARSDAGLISSSAGVSAMHGTTPKAIGAYVSFKNNVQIFSENKNTPTVESIEALDV